jgi:hypothetical protein
VVTLYTEIQLLIVLVVKDSFLLKNNKSVNLVCFNVFLVKIISPVFNVIQTLIEILNPHFVNVYPDFTNSKKKLSVENVCQNVPRV